jgi:uncharacterized membrane protein
MIMTQLNYDERLGELEQRVQRIEGHLGLFPPPRPQAQRPMAAPSLPVDVEEPEPQLQVADAADKSASPNPILEPLHAQVSPPPALPSPLHPAQKPVLSYPTSPKLKPVSQNPLEQVIGIKWAGWIGAIVLVIGAALGIKYAYDQGLFPTISPAARLVLMSFVGFALIGAGEWIFRKVGRLSATGFFGAGVATLFIISYAGHGYWPLYSRDTAFILMALCTLIGAAVAMRAQLVSVAVLSLIGGNIAPIVLRGDVSNLVPFLLYLLMFQAVALVLAFWGTSGKWWTLRGLSLATTGLWIAKLLAHPNPSFAWGSVMGFTLLYAALFQAEVLSSALRRKKQFSIERGGIVFSLITTALVSAAILRIFSLDEPWIRGTWLITFAAMTTLLSILLRRALPALAISYRVQAAALAVIAVPVVLSGATISIGWAVLALALAAVGGILSDRTSRAASIASWIFALANLALWTTTWHPTEAHHISFTVFGQAIPTWSVLATAIGLAGHFIALLAGWSREPADIQNEELNRISAAVSFLASAVFAFTVIAALPPLGSTGVLLAYAWLLVLLDRTSSRLSLAAQAWSVLLLATAKWAAIDIFAMRFSPHWNPANYRPILNPLMLTAAAIAGSLIAMFQLRRRALESLLQKTSARRHNPAIVSAIIAIAVITFGLSFEVDRTVEQLTSTVWPLMQLKLMNWTILWSIATVALFAAVRLIDPVSLGRSTWRSLAWTLCILLTLKFIVFDTAFFIISAGGHPAALLNAQTLTALVIVLTFAAIQWLLSDAYAAHETGMSLSTRVPLAATLVILWAGTLEISRLVSAGLFPGSFTWPHLALTQFAWTSWWTLGFAAYLAYVTKLDTREMTASKSLRKLAIIPILLGIKFLTLDTILEHVLSGPAAAPIVFNAQAATGAVIFAALLFLRYLLPPNTKLRFIAAAVAVLIPLWCGTIEIDRAFERSPAIIAMFTDPALAKQVAFSIFFSIYAIVCVTLGFTVRTAGLRYFGLALFALTLVKIAVLDLSRASTGYRFLSFIGLGALLMITSVLYGKLSPKLLRATSAPSTEQPTI